MQAFDNMRRISLCSWVLLEGQSRLWTRPVRIHITKTLIPLFTVNSVPFPHLLAIPIRLDFVPAIGKFGRWQFLAFVAIGLLYIPNTWSVGVIAFLNAKTDYWCSIPIELEQDLSIEGTFRPFWLQELWFQDQVPATRINQRKKCLPRDFIAFKLRTLT